MAGHISNCSALYELNVYIIHAFKPPFAISYCKYTFAVIQHICVLLSNKMIAKKRGR